MELNSRNLGSRCEAVIVNASRADEFQGGTSAGGVTWGVTGSELAEIVSKVT